MTNSKIESILNGELVIFPTDTVYGLGAIAEKKAIEKIYAIKKRDKSKKIIALISNIDKIKEITDEKIDENILKTFFPGPLTIITKSNDKFKDLVGDTVGIRMPNSKISLEIIEACGGILMTTSANISGEPSASTKEELSKTLLENVKNIFYTNNVLSGIPSTIVSYIDKNYELIREGEIKYIDILKVGGKINEI
ncbi:L-threonylcarbamoyladenylate synthase [Oceanivirga miroungae]|uniref:L-threonylcarbamoyladenylate synthase n=1 Tax=Oceanivirga miroungae TaxID=1130046 RepID=A0A6I8MDM9_9FUSO|nr:L-threonylcarbamoyladenylate synthase [Oceanivirga miroungae]VWL85553.1 Sua5/YciO/YrdC/YwlC family protein [Oceanivirga miroungae]